MSHADSLIARYFGARDGELHVGGLPMGAIVGEHGTPLFVYSSQVLDRKWATLRDALPPEFDICYSVKANPNPAILRYFLSKGAGLEIASGGELTLALHAGCPAERILFAGPGKTEAELELAVKHGIGEIHVESPVEARRLGAVARRLGARPPVALRVNPTGDAEGGAMRMGGRPAPFGVDEERLDETVDGLTGDGALEFCGLHLFTGTQILDHAILVRQFRKGLNLARHVAGRLGRPLRTLDFGGGLGIPYFPGEAELDTVKLRAELDLLMDEVRADPRLVGTRLVVEPGRFLVGEAGIYVARVSDVKMSRGKTFVILDGGMNHHLAASGNLGQVIKRNFPLAILNKIGQEPAGPAEVVGPLCTPLDTLGRNIAFPAPEIGDLVGIFQSGAYALTASPTNFLGHPTPAEVLVEAGTARLIRCRGAYADPLDTLA